MTLRTSTIELNPRPGVRVWINQLQDIIDGKPRQASVVINIDSALPMKTWAGTDLAAGLKWAAEVLEETYAAVKAIKRAART